MSFEIKDKIGQLSVINYNDLKHKTEANKHIKTIRARNS